MNNTIIYCRKSEKPKGNIEKMDEKGILSLESQEESLKEVAKARNLNVVKTFKENESAYKAGRPLFNEMIHLLKSGEVNTILVWHLSRISRNSFDGGQVIYLLDEGCLQAIHTPQKTYKNTGEDKFILNLELAMAKKSSDDNSSFVKRDIKAKAEKGEFPGKAYLGYLNIDKHGRIAGYKFDTAKQMMLENLNRPLKRIEIDPIEGDLVRKLFLEAAKGTKTLNELCKFSYETGLRANRSGKQLRKSSLKRMLENPFYYGAFLWEGNLYTQNIKHVGLVSKEVFDTVQENLSAKSFKKVEKNVYKFSALMECGECESTISSQIQKGIKYYHCPGYKAKKRNEKCSQRKYTEESVLEEQIVELLKTIEIPKVFIEWGKSVIRENFEQENKILENQRLANQNNLNSAKKKLHNLFELKISPKNQDGVLLSDEEYLVNKLEIQQEISGIKEKLKDSNSNEIQWLDKCEEFFDYTSRLQENFKQSDLEGKRTIIKSIGKIVLNNNQLAFKLKEPYLYAAKVAEATNKFLEISERQIDLQEDENGFFEPILDQWRNGRDSNPRPPA